MTSLYLMVCRVYVHDGTTIYIIGLYVSHHGCHYRRASLGFTGLFGNALLELIAIGTTLCVRSALVRSPGHVRSPLLTRLGGNY